VTHLRTDAYDGTVEQRPLYRHPEPSQVREHVPAEYPCREHGEYEPAHSSCHCLPGAHSRCKLAPADGSTGEVGADIRYPGKQEWHHNERGAADCIHGESVIAESVGEAQRHTD